MVVATSPEAQEMDKLIKMVSEMLMGTTLEVRDERTHTALIREAVVIQGTNNAYWTAFLNTNQGYSLIIKGISKDKIKRFIDSYLVEKI